MDFFQVMNEEFPASMFFWGGNKLQQKLRALNLEEMKNKCCRHS
jgi:hypothetical protein